MKLSLLDYDPKTGETLPTVYGTIELANGVLSFGGPDTARARQLFDGAMDAVKRDRKRNPPRPTKPPTPVPPITDQDVMTWLSKDSPKAANGRVRIDEP